MRCFFLGHRFRRPFPGTADTRTWCQRCGKFGGRSFWAYAEGALFSHEAEPKRGA